ncbi:hypothetical protein V8G54_037587 [Vigna mungo]|uniref:Retrotransposon gag domain-containing protein n=1 Tax=Vigna mungo TaxID=3915 RepID=A0AAQ3RE95_VIGMU
MGAALSTVYYNLNIRHPTLDLPVIDYDLALLIQPMLMLGISIGVVFNVVVADWMVTILLIILFLGTSAKAFCKGVETWKKETIVKELLPLLEGHALYGHIDGSIKIPHAKFPIDDGSLTVPNPAFITWKQQQIWTTLECLYGGHSKQREIGIRDQLLHLTKGSSTVREFSKTFRGLCDQLSLMGRPVDDLDKLHWFLRGLAMRPLPVFHDLFLLPRVLKCIYMSLNPLPLKLPFIPLLNVPLNHPIHIFNLGHVLSQMAKQVVGTTTQVVVVAVKDAVLSIAKSAEEKVAHLNLQILLNHLQILALYQIQTSLIVTVGNCNALPISHIGSHRLANTLNLLDILVVPGLQKNLISISKLTRDFPVDAIFTYTSFLLQQRGTKEILAKGRREHNLYALEDGTISPISGFGFSSFVEPTSMPELPAPTHAPTSFLTPSKETVHSSTIPCGLCPTEDPSSPIVSMLDTQPQISRSVQPTHPIVTRAKSGIFRPRHFADITTYQPFSLLCAMLTTSTSKGFKFAGKHPGWLDAMHKELLALHSNNTWDLVPCPSSTNIVGTK